MPQASLVLSSDPEVVLDARRFVGETLRSWGTEVDTDAAVLLVSEAVTNVVVHGRPPAGLQIDLSGVRVRFSVTDSAPELLPVVRQHDDEAERGRGMQIIDLLASRWGIDVADGAKTFWFEVA